MTLFASIDHGAKREPIHHSTTFGFDGPTTCGKTDVPKPAASEWRYVECPRCLALKPPEVHARQSASATALCGLVARDEDWTTKRSAVTCPACQGEVERRKAIQRSAF